MSISTHIIKPVTSVVVGDIIHPVGFAEPFTVADIYTEEGLNGDDTVLGFVNLSKSGKRLRGVSYEIREGREVPTVRVIPA